MFGYTLENWAKLQDDIFELGMEYPRTLKRELYTAKSTKLLAKLPPRMAGK
jgi:hypothetical protein